MARNEGRRYCNTSVLAYQAERMPDPIRLTVSIDIMVLIHGNISFIVGGRTITTASSSL